MISFHFFFTGDQLSLSLSLVLRWMNGWEGGIWISFQLLLHLPPTHPPLPTFKGVEARSCLHTQSRLVVLVQISAKAKINIFVIAPTMILAKCYWHRFWSWRFDWRWWPENSHSLPPSSPIIKIGFSVSSQVIVHFQVTQITVYHVISIKNMHFFISHAIYDKNIGPGETSQAVTLYHFFNYSYFFGFYH